jgi:hypothetical protein
VPGTDARTRDASSKKAQARREAEARSDGARCGPAEGLRAQFCSNEGRFLSEAALVAKPV